MKITASKTAMKAAKNYIPGGVNSPVRACISLKTNPLFIEKALGAEIYDIDGNHYIDFVQSWGPLLFGHRDKTIESAVIDAAKHGLSFGAPTLIETELAKEVVNTFESIDKIRFVSSGTEAVMSAIRLARGFQGKDDIIKFEGCYHGHSDSLLVQTGGGASDCGTPSSPGVPEDFTKHTLIAKYNNIESVKHCFSQNDQIACVIIEPIAGNMGLVPANLDFLVELRSLCDEHHALLIFDEVMSGFRATPNGVEKQVGVKPDLVTLGKVLGGGLPVGAFGGRHDIMSHLAPEGPVYQAGTLSGNPIAMAAGLAAIRKLNADPQLIPNLEKKGKKLITGMKKAAQKNGIPLQTSIRGSIFGFFFNEKKITNFDDAVSSNLKLFTQFHTEMLNEGYYFACSQLETGFISTAMTDTHIEETIAAFERVFKKMA